MCRMLHSRLRFLAISAGARCGGPSRPLQLTRPGLEHQVWACHSCGAARIENHSNQSSRGDYCAARMTKASVLSSYPTVSSTNNSPTVWPSSATAMKVASSWSYVTNPCTNIAATSCPSAPKTTSFKPPAFLTYRAASARVVTIAGIPFCWCFVAAQYSRDQNPMWSVQRPEVLVSRVPGAAAGPSSAVRHIAALSPTRSFETLVCRLFQDNVGGPPSMPGVMALPQPRRYALRSQVFSPCRGSDPGIRDSGLRHRAPAPVERVVAAARCRASRDHHRLAQPLTARSQPRLRPGQSHPRDRVVSPPEHPSQECPTPAAVPRGPDGRRQRA